MTTKSVTETVWDWELNQTKPIWTRNPKEVTEEEYNTFYNVISKDVIEPLMHIHFLAEGEVEFKSLLYIPSTPPGNLFDPNPENQPKGVRLYVRRVFITGKQEYFEITFKTNSKTFCPNIWRLSKELSTRTIYH